MGAFLDTVPFSGIIRIRDLMFSIENPYRLDQGDVSFDAPDTVKEAMARGIAENRSHYVQTAGVPRLRELIAEKLQRVNGIPASVEDVLVANGGMHALYMVCQALLEPGDEVIVPDPEWPPCMGNIAAARGISVPCPLHERLQWRWNVDEIERVISPRTRAIYVNSPNNPTGGVLTRADLERVAEIARERNLWVIADEAYEDLLYDGRRHVSIASLPGMYERTIPFFTFSKSYAITGLRLGYVAIKDPVLRQRMIKVGLYTASNVSSLIQYGGIGALEGSQQHLEDFRTELSARRDLFYAGIREHASDMFTGEPPAAALYAFLRINPEWRAPAGASTSSSSSWAMTEYLIRESRLGSVPGVDFGANGEGCVRFCFARDRRELTGALEALGRASVNARVKSPVPLTVPTAARPL